ESAPWARAATASAGRPYQPTSQVMTQTLEQDGAVDKIPTGMGGFDIIAKGGLPRNRTTLVSGTAGSGKTVFAMQFLAAGIQDHGEGGVFVTFEETARDIRKNMRSF